MIRRLVNFPTLLAAGFLVLLLVQISNHVMWRDELRPWQIIRECSTPADVMREMRFDAVPALWNFIIFGLTRVTDNPFSMQLVHALIASAVVYVVARWAPFSKTSKILFSLGYFPFFEYATIARNYSLVFLLVMITCALISQPRIRWGLLGVVLFLLTQVSIWGAGFAGLLFVVAMLQLRGDENGRPHGFAAIGVVGTLLLVGIGLCIAAIVPGPGPTFIDSWKNVTWPERIVQSIGVIYRAWVPIPRWELHFWNTNILDSVPVVQAILGMTLMLLAVGSVARRPVAMGWLLMGSTVLVGFALWKFRGSARHDGMLFIVLIAAFWLASSERMGAKQSFAGTGAMDRLERSRPVVLAAILWLNALGGLMAAGQGMIHPFSATRAVAEYIQKQVKEPVVLAAHYDYCASPVGHWLDRPFYSIAIGREVRVNSQDDSIRRPPAQVDAGVILNAIYDLVQDRRSTVLLLANADVVIRHSGPIVRFPAGPNGPFRYLEVADVVDPSFGQSVVADEAHRLYLMRLAILPVRSTGGGGGGLGRDEPLVGEQARQDLQGHVLGVP